MRIGIPLPPSRVTSFDYGPVTVVRDRERGMAWASADGPQSLPVLVTCSGRLTDGRIILLAAQAAWRSWEEAGGMPDDVREAFTNVVSFDPLRLLVRGTDRGRTEDARLYSRQT